MNPNRFRLRALHIFISLMLCLLMFCGCSSGGLPPAAPAPSPTATPSNTPEPVPTPAATAQPTPAATPSEAPVEPEPEPSPEPIAQDLSHYTTVTLNGGSVTSDLTDYNHNTRRYFGTVEKLRFECSEAVYAIYIEWAMVPGEYTLTWDGGSITCGTDSFLHEYIVLPEPVYSIDFSFPGDGFVSVCDILPLGDGTPPDTVQCWLPPYQEADILVFPTHSDDDTLFFGPLISYYATERDMTVQTAFMVNHVLYPHRSHERLDGLWELGLRHYPILGNFPDCEAHDLYAALEVYELSAVTRWQVEQIRRFRPLVVVGHDLDGEYGNGGHKVNALCLTDAIEAAANPQQYPESAELYGVWDTPKLYLHLYEENSITLDVNTPLSNDYKNRTPFAVAEDAFAHHRSQQNLGFFVAQEEQPDYDCRLFGLYRSLVGPDSGSDIMENIDLRH